jgi:hypothetical protein
MARFGVRSGSLPFARQNRNACKYQLERTHANGRERSLAFAMQKVVGSSPIIRLDEAPANGGFFVSRAGAAERKMPRKVIER